MALKSVMTLKSGVKRILPRPVKSALRPAYRLWVRINQKDRQPTSAEVSTPEQIARPGELLPPPDLQAYIGGGFREVGPEFLEYFKNLAGLQPHEAVLDVGSGSGRMAVPLTEYLDSRGRYDGFDISAEAINWCRANITRKYPNFSFKVADIYSGTYKPNGKLQASEYRFPYDDESFDLVFLTSVFTHMLPRDMEHYFAEIARVLRPRGRCLITFFLLNSESVGLMERNLGDFNFEFRQNGYRTISPERPEDAVAYDEMFVRGLFIKCGLAISEPIQYGSWCGRQKSLTLQDLVIATKDET